MIRKIGAINQRYIVSTCVSYTFREKKISALFRYSKKKTSS